jgi:hypothetical protein
MDTKAQRRNSVVIAPPRPVVVVLGLAALLVIYVGVGFSGVTEAHDARLKEYVIIQAVIIALTLLFLAGMTARAETEGSVLRIYGVFRQYTVGRAAIDEMEYSNGVVVKLHNGARIELTAYGTSTFQDVFPSARFRNVGKSMTRWASTAHDEGDSRSVDSSVRLRSFYFTFAPFYIFTHSLIAVLVWNNPDALYRLMLWLFG